MAPQTIFLLVMGASVLNGLLHQMTGSLPFVVLLQLAPVWWPEVFGFYLEPLIYATTLIITTATLLLGGIPAALYERLRGLSVASAGAMWLWLAGVITIMLVMAPTLAVRAAG